MDSISSSLYNDRVVYPYLISPGINAVILFSLTEGWICNADFSGRNMYKLQTRISMIKGEKKPSISATFLNDFFMAIFNFLTAQN